MKKLVVLFFTLFLSSCIQQPLTEEEKEKSTFGYEDTESEAGNCLTKSFGAGVPGWIVDNFECVQVTMSGGNYKFVTNDIPEHNSAYFDDDDHRYTSEMPWGRRTNPNEISEQNYVMYITSAPSSSGGIATNMDAIGIAVDGVVFYNNQAAAPHTLANEIYTLDTANGHPTHTGAYHYHIEPVEITNNDSKLIGVLRDGFPVFGRKCPTNNLYPGNGTAALDNYNGHTSDTGIDGLDTIYHYHVADIASDDGDGVSEPIITDTYYGTPGIMTRN